MPKHVLICPKLCNKSVIKMTKLKCFLVSIVKLIMEYFKNKKHLILFSCVRWQGAREQWSEKGCEGMRKNIPLFLFPVGVVQALYITRGWMLLFKGFNQYYECIYIFLQVSKIIIESLAAGMLLPCSNCILNSKISDTPPLLDTSGIFILMPFCPWCFRMTPSGRCTACPPTRRIWLPTRVCAAWSSF